MASNEPYWPPGWSRERLVNSTNQEVMTTLDEAEYERMFDSLKTALGPDDFAALTQEMSANHRARLARERAAAGRPLMAIDQLAPERRVPLLATLRDRCPDGPFGWVAYRTCCYGDDSTWKSFREKWDQFIDHEFEEVIHIPGVREAKARFEIRWIEDVKFAGISIDDIAAHYRGLEPTLPITGFQHGLCLVVGDSEVQSVLQSPCPTPNPIKEQLLLPYVLGVVKDAGADPATDQLRLEEHDWRTSFKIALEALVGDLIRVLFEDMRSPSELSAGLDDDEIWWAMTGRHGIFKIGVREVDG